MDIIKKNVAVIFGSRSAEHDVSIITALNSVIRPLKLSEVYVPIPVYIAKNGKWYMGDPFGSVEVYQQKDFAAWLEEQTPVMLKLGDGLSLVTPGRLRSKETRIDIAFPATHGTFGEDGALMGLLEMAGIPYVGCGVSASAVAMDKVLAKKVAGADGVSVVPFVDFTKTEVEQDQAAVVAKILKHAELKKAGYPYFVKPAHLGSSIGITMVQNEAELKNAIEVALHYDDLALVEFAVPNLIEVTVPVMGNGHPRIAIIEQPLTKNEEFFDFTTKYLGQGGKKGGKGTKSGSGKRGAQGYSQIPAHISQKLYAECEQMALQIYRSLGCSGTARIDLLINSQTNKVYFNEINPLPGSLYAHNWRAAGLSSIVLVTKLLMYAEERAAQKATRTTTFTSSFLQQF
jgi:D-alanine-D-alanine ligase